jgi:hypothetical protein
MARMSSAEAQRRTVGSCPQCDLGDTVLHDASGSDTVRWGTSGTAGWSAARAWCLPAGPCRARCCGGMRTEATSIMACMTSAEAQRGTGPLEHHVLPVRCVVGSDVAIHEVQAPACTMWACRGQWRPAHVEPGVRRGHGGNDLPPGQERIGAAITALTWCTWHLNATTAYHAPDSIGRNNGKTS